MRFFYIIFFIFCYFFSKAQETDTIIVYEEVIVYDTVYIDKKKPEKKEIPKKQKPYYLQNKKRRIVEDGYSYGVEVFGGSKKLDLFTGSNAKGSAGGGAGVWFQREYYFPEMLSIRLGVNISHWPRTYYIDKYSANNKLSGFYFNKDGVPALFENFNNKHDEISVPISVAYSIGGFSPFIGFSTNFSVMKMNFYIPENDIFGKIENFSSNNLYFGFIYGLRFKAGRFNFSAEMSHSRYKQLKFGNKALNSPIIFKVNDGIMNQKILFGIQYSLKMDEY